MVLVHLSTRVANRAEAGGSRGPHRAPIRVGAAIAMAIGVAVAVAVAGLTGCGSAPGAPTLTVFAAASLRQTFTEIAEQFKTDNPGVGVSLEFGGSSELATQLVAGAQADVFASANSAQMEKVAGAGLLAGKSARFATNTLVIVTAPGNPRKVESFADLARPGLSVVVCQPQVPCGAATEKIEQNTRIRVDAASEEPDVTDVLGKVTSGQADVGLVYRTDAINAGDRVTTIEFPEAVQAVNTYPIAALRDGPQTELARKFVDLVTGEVGRKILHRVGFGPVSASADL